MKDLASYFKAAIDRNGIASDRQLSHALDLEQTAIWQMRHRGVLPSDSTMLRLADLAGVDPVLALLDLNTWRAKDPNVRRVYGEIGKRLADVAKMTGGTLGIVAFLGTATPVKQADAGDLVARVMTVDARLPAGPERCIMRLLGLLRSWLRWRVSRPRRPVLLPA